MRGVYENPEGSGIWWIHYYAAGKRHREKVGRKSDAIKLYQSRKADATAGRKLPELRDFERRDVLDGAGDVFTWAATGGQAIVSRGPPRLVGADWIRLANNLWLFEPFVLFLFRHGTANQSRLKNPAPAVQPLLPRRVGQG